VSHPDRSTDPSTGRSAVGTSNRSCGRRSHQPPRRRTRVLRQCPPAAQRPVPGALHRQRMERQTAPPTFATKREAHDYLAVIRADMFRGAWRASMVRSVAVMAEELTCVASWRSGPWQQHTEKRRHSLDRGLVLQ
jgi:hypothetical protein